MGGDLLGRGFVDGARRAAGGRDQRLHAGVRDGVDAAVGAEPVASDGGWGRGGADSDADTNADAASRGGGDARIVSGIGPGSRAPVRRAVVRIDRFGGTNAGVWPTRKRSP